MVLNLPPQPKQIDSARRSSDDRVYQKDLQIGGSGGIHCTRWLLEESQKRRVDLLWKNHSIGEQSPETKEPGHYQDQDWDMTVEEALFSSRHPGPDRTCL
jgi:hypothetical protein